MVYACTIDIWNRGERGYVWTDTQVRCGGPYESNRGRGGMGCACVGPMWVLVGG
jgi:hypothetical protein